MSQQLLNLGGVANDRTGDDWRTGGEKINDNFSELFTTGGLTNVIHVNTPDDLPAAVGGVRELSPPGGAAVVYLIAAVEIDVGSDVFTITNGEVVIRGLHRTESQITTSSAGTMFTVVDSPFFQEFVSFSCGGEWVNFSNPSGGVNSFANNNLIIRTCATLGNIDNAFVCSFRLFTVVTTTAGGFTWSGSTPRQINMSNFLALDWVGTLFDLGTAIFSLISITPGNRWISPAGTTILTGAANSANMSSGGRALVAGNIFNGLGTALSGITTQDLQWDFIGNVFADGTTENTRRDADTFLLTNESVANAGSDVYTPIAGGNWQSDIANRFTADSDGIFTYTGLDNVDVPVSASATVEKGGGGVALICSKIAIDTGSGFTVIDKTIGCTENSTATQITSTLLRTISNGDRFQLWVSIDDGVSTVEVANARMIIGGAR